MNAHPAQRPEDILAEARNCESGDGCIQDFTEALRLYKEAAKLGCVSAYAYIGSLYEHGRGIRRDDTKALEYYKQGARKGNAHCYWKMALMYHLPSGRKITDCDSTQYSANADKCFSLFVQHFQKSVQDRIIDDTDLFNIMVELGVIVDDMQNSRVRIPKPLDDFLFDHTDIPLLKMKTYIRQQGGSSKSSFLSKLDDIVEILEARKRTLTES